MKKQFLIIFFLVFSFILSSCIKESDSLVNPPSKSGTVYVRVINLSADLQQRTLVFDKTINIDQLSYGIVSKAFHPTADSSMLKIKKGNADEFSQTNPIKYFRNTNYTFYLLSNKACADCPTDTIITLRTTTSIPEDSRDAFLKVINAVPDSTISYAVRMGCPSGEPVFANVPYRATVPTAVQLLSGKIPVSVVRLVKTGTSVKEEFVNLYELDVQAKGQYTLVFKKGDFAFEDLMILDEMDTTTNALQPVRIVKERTSELRVVNLSSAVCDIEKKGAESVVGGLQQSQISDYKVLSACQSKARDSIEIYVNDQLKSTAVGSLDVLSQYSVIIVDSANSIAKKSYIIPPHKYREEYDDKSLIRVLHSHPSTKSLTISLGARKSALAINSSRKFSSGTILSDKLEYDELSNVIAVEPGEAPIAIFTAAEPVQLVYAANGYLEAGKSYLLVINANKDGEIQLYLVEDSEINKQTTTLNRGVFVQYINAVSDASKVEVSLNGLNPNLLDKAMIEYTGSTATVIPPGNNILNVNGFTTEFNIDTTQRLLLISTGKSSTIETIENRFTPLDLSVNQSLLRYRFINATSDAQLINIREFAADSMPIIESAYFKNSSNYLFDSRLKVISYYIFNDTDSNYIHRLSDLTVTPGKSYAIIFAGLKNPKCQEKKDPRKKTEPNCYSIIIQQEF